MRRHSQGFTLIEVMITVAIVAILAAIALPSYTEYVRRAKITDAVAGLSEMRLKMEQYFQDNRSYSPPLPAIAPCNAGTVAPLPAATTNFQYSCTNLGPNTYTVTATGINSMNGFVYTLDQSNTRTSAITFPGWASSGTCWVLKKDGSC